MSAPESWPSAADAAGVTPEEAFALLGNATRLSILRTLWEAGESIGSARLTFSELREHAGVTDSGQFNYHLDQLVPQFVVHEDDAYGLSFAGRTVLKAVVAGTVTSDLALDPVEVDERCFYCGAPVTVQFRGGVVCIACSECEGSVRNEAVPGLLLGFELPPAGLAGRSPEHVLEATLAYELARTDARIEGVCPDCGGRVDQRLQLCEDHPESGYCDACEWRLAGRVDWRCDSCHDARSGPGFAIALHHQATAAFLHEHDMEPRRGSWEFITIASHVTESVTSTDPMRVTYSVTVDGERLDLEVDADATISSVNRRPA